MFKHPLIRKWLRILKKKVGILVIRRHREENPNTADYIITNLAFTKIVGRLNTQKEAEACGYWVVSRRQRGKKQFYKEKQVFVLFLTPVHPKKKFEQIAALEPAHEFYPIPRKEPLPQKQPITIE